MATLIEENTLGNVSSDSISSYLAAIRTPKDLAKKQSDANPFHEGNALARLYQSEGYG